jgi:hypothetical protein
MAISKQKVAGMEEMADRASRFLYGRVNTLSVYLAIMAILWILSEYKQIGVPLGSMVDGAVANIMNILPHEVRKSSASLVAQESLWMQ